MRTVNCRKTIGQLGEAAAVCYLQKNGFRILTRNYRNRYGEIDIIACEKKQVCFIEVKTRASTSCGDPWEAVSAAKQNKIARLALVFLQENEWDNVQVRFDVVAVMVDQSGHAEVEILRDAFEVNDPRLTF